jgi:competence protein ComEA
MKKSRNLFVLTLLTLALATTAFADDAAAPASAGVVNLNTASAEQLSLLPRVGEKAAARIIAWRTENGPFRKTTDLLQVKGFGAKTYERVAPYVVVDGKTTLSTKIKSPRKPRAKAQPTTTASN